MRVLLRCFLALLFPALAQTQTATAPADRPITIGRIDSLWSPTLKENRSFMVYTPPGYTSRSTRHVPTRYCTCSTVTRTSTPSRACSNSSARGSMGHTSCPR